MSFTREFIVGWADLDANAHTRNTAYLDHCVDVRIMYFAEHGFAAGEFARLRLGPVVQRDEVEYFRELRLLDRYVISLELAGQSTDGSRFRILNEITRTDGVRVARVISTGGWLDLEARRLTAPPDALLAVMRAMPRSQDYAELKSSLRRTPPESLAT